MTEEVDPRLVALGLVPAPPGWREQTLAQIERAAAAAAAEASAPTQESPWSTVPSQPSAPGDIFAGMGKFTGMPPETPTAQPPSAGPSPWTTPSTQPPPPDQSPWTTSPWTTPSVERPAAVPDWTTPTHAPPAYMPPPAAPSYTPEPPPQSAPPAYTPPPYIPAPVAPPVPETPRREAPPPLPPLAATMPTAKATAVEAPPIPAKKEKAKKVKPEKKEKVAKAEKVKPPKVAKPAKVKPPPKPRFILPPSGVLLRGPIVMGYPEKKLQITLEQLGFRINGPEPVDVAWTDVREIKARRGRVVVRTKGKPVAFGIPVEGIAEPTLAGPLARVVKEASGGSLDLAGSAFLELQNATDSLRDHYHDEDDPLIPTVVGLVFVLAGLTITALLPDALAIATRTPVAPGAYLLDNPLAVFDPRILVASFAAGSMLAAGVVRVAMGKAATGWARGTLRGWHEGGRRTVDLARRALAALILNPAIAAALLLVAVVLTLPSARVQTVIDGGGLHLMRVLPFFDDNKPWAQVTEITTVNAPTVQHFEGFAVVFKFQDGSTVSTLHSHLRGGTDKQLLESANAWREGRSRP